MTSQTNSVVRSHNPKSKQKSRSQSHDSESETAVTSTSGHMVNAVVAKTSKGKQPSKSSTAARSALAVRTPLTSKAVFGHERGSQSRKRRVETARNLNAKIAAVGELTSDDSDLSPGSQRLLMREWLLHEASLNRIPGLKFQDKDRTQLCIPWIHASKEGWSQEHHCKLFEYWAIHTGKYNPERDRPDPKRWKANFRCALNSLRDVTEIPDQGRKNGMDGYKVYQFHDAVSRKDRKRPTVSNHTVTSKSFDVEHLDQYNLQSFEPSSSFPIFSASLSPYELAEFEGNPVIIAYTEELAYETVPQGEFLISEPSGIPANDDVNVVIAGKTGSTNSRIKARLTRVSMSGTETDIVTLRNMDHNYFKAQIPTTVENFEDDDGLLDEVKHIKVQRPST